MATLSGLYRPQTLPEALALLAQDHEAKPLSGGATLVAMMNARVIAPTALVSLAEIVELQGISKLVNGSIRIGAFTRHRETACSDLLVGTLALVCDAASLIANATVRNMGTIGGALAFADPGLDYPPALVAAGASIELASIKGTRKIAAKEFFIDWYTTALQPGEIVSAVILPPARPGYSRYYKHARVAGDYAIASLALTIAPNADTRVAIGGCGPAPITITDADQLLSRDQSDAAMARAAAMLVAESDPMDDVRGSGNYRRLLIPRLLARAMADARAQGAFAP